MENDKVLLERISSGDERAFRLLFDLYRTKVYSYALKMIKCDIQAEDVLQDVFLKIWQHQHLDEIDNFECYLRTMTRNHVLKILRKQQVEMAKSSVWGAEWSEAHNETEDLLLLNESAQILNEGISQLPSRQKLVYNLCREQGLKYEAVAKMLSISPLTVKTHMQHSLRFLRNYLSKHTDIAKVWLSIHCLLEIIK